MGGDCISYKFPQNQFPQNKASQNILHQEQFLQNISDKKQQQKISNYQTGEIENFLEPDIFMDAVVSLFFHIDTLKKFLSPNINLELPTFKYIILTKVHQKIKKYKRYDLIIEEILTKIDPDNVTNKEYYNQAQQYDEAKGLKFFLENHKSKLCYYYLLYNIFHFLLFEE